VTANTEKEAKMYAECPNVSTGLTRDPEHGEVALFIKLQKLRFMDGAYSELPFHGRDKRWSLEERSRKGLQSTGKSGRIGECGMQAQDTDVLLT